MNVCGISIKAKIEERDDSDKSASVVMSSAVFITPPEAITKNYAARFPLKKSTVAPWARHEAASVPGAGCDAALCSGTRQPGGCVPGPNHKYGTVLPANH